MFHHFGLEDAPLPTAKAQHDRSGSFYVLLVVIFTSLLCLRMPARRGGKLHHLLFPAFVLGFIHSVTDPALSKRKVDLDGGLPISGTRFQSLPGRIRFGGADRTSDWRSSPAGGHRSSLMHLVLNRLHKVRKSLMPPPQRLKPLLQLGSLRQSAAPPNHPNRFTSLD
jgi:hypothetical protein